jgi:hypothetical protein
VSGQRNLPFGMIGLVGVLRCGFGDQGGAHELDVGAAGGLVVEELAGVPVRVPR